MKLPIISSWVTLPEKSTTNLEKRKKVGLPKNSPDVPAAIFPSKNVGKDGPNQAAKPSAPPGPELGKDLPAAASPSKSPGKDQPLSAAKTSVVPDVDVGKDLPTSDPKPGAAPSTMTTTVISTVSASNEVSTVTTTVHQTKTKTITVSAATSSTSDMVSGITLSGAALTNAILAEKGRSSKNMVSSRLAQDTGYSTLTSHHLSATPEMDRAAVSAQPARTTVTSTVTHTVAPTCSSVPARKNQLSPATTVAIVLGLFILVLLAAMVFLVRKFHKLYKAEEMLRKQAQIETKELKEAYGQNPRAGTTVVDRPSKGMWGFTRKEAWEK